MCTGSNRNRNMKQSVTALFTKGQDHNHVHGVPCHSHEKQQTLQKAQKSCYTKTVFLEQRANLSSKTGRLMQKPHHGDTTTCATRRFPSPYPQQNPCENITNRHNHGRGDKADHNFTNCAGILSAPATSKACKNEPLPVGSPTKAGFNTAARTCHPSYSAGMN